MKFKTRAFIVFAAALFAAATAAAQSPRILTFQNMTCGQITLSVEPNDSCAALATGCRFTLDYGMTHDMSLGPAEYTPYFEAKVDGRCRQAPPAVISGRCSFDADRLFPQSPIQMTEGPPEDMAFEFYDSAGIYDPFETVYGGGQIVPQQFPPVMITVETSDCQLSGDGSSRVCTVDCRRRPY